MNCLYNMEAIIFISACLSLRYVSRIAIRELLNNQQEEICD